MFITFPITSACPQHFPQDIPAIERVDKKGALQLKLTYLGPNAPSLQVLAHLKKAGAQPSLENNLPITSHTHHHPYIGEQPPLAEKSTGRPCVHSAQLVTNPHKAYQLPQ